MAKKNIVTQKQLDDFRKKTGNPEAELRDYMNAFKFDEDKGKYVKREKALTRRKDPTSPKTENRAPTIIKDSRSAESNYTNKRADALNMVPSRSTRSDSSRVQGTTNVKTEEKKKGGNPLFMKKGGYVQSKGGAAGGVKKKKTKSNVSSRADGIVKKGRTKGRMV